MLGGRWAFTAIAAVALLGLGLADPQPDPNVRLTEPTKVVLDFKDRTAFELVRVTAKRSGKKIHAFRNTATKAMVGMDFIGGMPEDQDAGLRWRYRMVTLEAPEPVPFWEAIDRIARGAGIQYRLVEFGDTGAANLGLNFEGDGAPPGPASYSGPFRVGLRGVYERRQDKIASRKFGRSANQNGDPGEADPMRLDPLDGGSFFAEIELAAEPGLVCRRDGPIRTVDAVDEMGRSLYAHRDENPRQAVQAFASIDGGLAPMVRIPLRRTGQTAGSKTIKRLRGLIPVEIGQLQEKPAIAIPLGSSEGKTFRGGGAEFRVLTDRIEGGIVKFAVSCRLIGETDPNRRDARLAVLRTYQIKMVDAKGAPSHSSASSGGGGAPGELEFSYNFDPEQITSKLPAEFQYYGLDRVSTQIPFEFKDIPLP